MGSKRLTRTILSLSVLIFTVNLFLFSIQSYVPATPAPDNPAYSADFCTPHKTDPGIRVLHRLFDGSNRKEGVEKHCFHHCCCLKRQYYMDVLREVTPLGTEFTVYGEHHDETVLAKDFAKHVSSRSPPHFLV